MAARRKRIAKASAGEAGRASAIVVEDLRSQFNVFGEALQGFRAEVATAFRGFREEVATQFAEVDKRFDGIHREIALVKVVLVEHTRDIREIRGDSRETRGELREVQATVTRIEAALDRKVDRDEVGSIVAGAIGRP